MEKQPSPLGNSLQAAGLTPTNSNGRLSAASSANGSNTGLQVAPPSHGNSSNNVSSLFGASDDNIGSTPQTLRPPPGPGPGTGSNTGSPKPMLPVSGRPSLDPNAASARSVGATPKGAHDRLPSRTLSVSTPYERSQSRIVIRAEAGRLIVTHVTPRRESALGEEDASMMSSAADTPPLLAGHGSTASGALESNRSVSFVDGGATATNIMEFNVEDDPVGLASLIPTSYLSWRYRLYCVLEGIPLSKQEHWSLIFNIVSVFFILASIIVFCVESLPQFASQSERSRLDNPLFWIETTCVGFFVLEALLRAYCVRPLINLFNFYYVVDVLTVVGYFVDLFTNASISGISGPLRLLRVFRVFKLTRYSLSLRLAFNVLRSSMAGLSLLVLPLVIIVISSASLIFFFEILQADWDTERHVWLDQKTGQPIQIQSIPWALWFSFTTVATVGYGDIVPRTLGGRIVAGCLQLVGVLTLSLPNIVFGANLQHAFQQKKQAHAIRYLTKRFRKVLIVVQFVRRMQQLVALRRGSEHEGEPPEPLQRIPSVVGLRSTRPTVNFFARELEFESVSRKTRMPAVAPDSIRTWGADRDTLPKPVMLLQILLEAWSGVALVPELAEEMLQVRKGPQSAVRNVTITALSLAAGGYLKAFILMRNTPRILLALTESAVAELLMHRELGSLTCRRSAEHARVVWKQTTGTPVPYRLSNLHSEYHTWSSEEAGVVASADTQTDLKSVVEAPAWGEVKDQQRDTSKLTMEALHASSLAVRTVNAEVLAAIARLSEHDDTSGLIRQTSSFDVNH